MTDQLDMRCRNCGLRSTIQTVDCPFCHSGDRQYRADREGSLEAENAALKAENQRLLEDVQTGNAILAADVVRQYQTENDALKDQLARTCDERDIAAENCVRNVEFCLALGEKNETLKAKCARLEAKVSDEEMQKPPDEFCPRCGLHTISHWPFKQCPNPATYCVCYMLSSENIWRSIDGVPFEQVCAVQDALDPVTTASMIRVKHERMITEAESQALPRV